MDEFVGETYYQRNRNVILNRAKDYYENDKENIREQARDKYRKLSEEGETVKQEAVYFGENGISKNAFHKDEKHINISEADIEEIVLSHKKSNGKDSFKCFIGYRRKGSAFPSPLYVKLPQINAYA